MIQRNTTFSLIGQASCASYEARGIMINRLRVMPGSGWNGTYTETFHVKRNGVLIGFSHVTFHDTFNPDGEHTSEIINVVQECF